MKNKTKTQKIGIMATFISLGLVLQYAESKILIAPALGGKLGLANIISVINLFVFDGKNALVIAGIRSLLGGIVSGGASTIPYSLAGALTSVLIMWVASVCLKDKVSMIGLSILGAVFHNIAQLSVAAFTYGTGYVYTYLPILMVISLISGTATGYAAQIFYDRIFKAKKGTN